MDFQVAVASVEIYNRGTQLGMTDLGVGKVLDKAGLYDLRPVDTLHEALRILQCRLGPDIVDVSAYFYRFRWQQYLLHNLAPVDVPVGHITLLSDQHPEYNETLSSADEYFGLLRRL